MSRKKITGQVIYCGPMMPAAGLQYGTIFRNGIFPQQEALLNECPSLAGLFVPVANYALVRRELNFDLARNMRGVSGKFVTYYREVEKWLALRGQRNAASTTTGVKLKQHG
jgi:hypothetical protein